MAHLTPQEEKAVREFKKRLQTLLGPDLLNFRLFGSRARREGNEGSDVDLLILAREAPVKLRGQIFEIAADIFLEYEVNLSPLVMSQQHYEDMKHRERLLAKEIERDGIPL